MKKCDSVFVKYAELDDETHEALFGVAKGDSSVLDVYLEQEYCHTKTAFAQHVAVQASGRRDVDAYLPPGYLPTGGGILNSEGGLPQLVLLKFDRFTHPNGWGWTGRIANADVRISVRAYGLSGVSSTQGR